MNAKSSLFSAVLIATCASGIVSGIASAHPPSRPENLLFYPANRLVGNWQSQVTIGPCAGGPKSTFLAAGVFNAGGTLGYTSTAIPPSGVGPTFGTWDYTYDRSTHTLQYRARMQFFRYKPDGSLDGTQDIHRTITLSRDAQRMDETVVVDVLNADGSLRVKLCGTGSGQRIGIE